MNLYTLYKYTPIQIIEVEYLLEQAKRFNILDQVRDAFFQFSPLLITPKESTEIEKHEPWAIFHKQCIINELIFYLIEKVYTDKYIITYLTDKQIWDEIFTPFILKTDFLKLKDEEIYALFKNYIEKNNHIEEF